VFSMVKTFGWNMWNKGYSNTKISTRIAISQVKKLFLIL